MAEIISIRAFEALDSRGYPTVAVRVYTKTGSFLNLVPSGASTGVHEALELRDSNHRYSGKGVQQAVKNVNDVISKKVVGMNPEDQSSVDKIMIELDGTENKEKLGANAILGVSLAVCQAGAASKNIPLYEHLQHLSSTSSLSLPVPQLNVINSGKHVGVENDIQEHLLLPEGLHYINLSLAYSLRSPVLPN